MIARGNPDWPRFHRAAAWQYYADHREEIEQAILENEED
jgi:hypothetical protein